MKNENQNKKSNIQRLSNNINTTSNGSQAIRLSNMTSNITRLGTQPINENEKIPRLNLETVRKGLGNEAITFSKKNKKSNK